MNLRPLTHQIKKNKIHYTLQQQKFVAVREKKTYSLSMNQFTVNYTKNVILQNDNN